jgi:hypothetical protein
MLWGNEEAIYGGDQLFAHAGTAEGLSVSYSNVEGGLDAIGTCCDPPMGQSGVITWGPGNIDADPLFTSNSDPGPDGEWGTRDDEYGDLRLQPGSPCIDAADDSPVCSISDLSGNPRRLDDPASADTGAGRAPTPDMGAYEFVPSDCNANGIPDDREADLDGNGNSIPDQCELVLDDCDQDGIIDGCEQSSDCNDNGAADSCDITSGLSQDCNKNHVPDECDIASGFAQDDNLDGVPDTCSCVTLSDCADLNGDGIRNSACAWWTCESGTCAQTAISYADMGGSFGDCPPDGTVDAHDIFHALNCFADLDTMGNAQSYPCEPDPPNALNADAGGPFGFCCPDGVCDGNDAFHVLNVFAGVTPCTCPYLFCPCTPWAGTCSNDPYQSCTFLSGCDEGAYCNLVWCPPAPAPDPPPNGGARVVGTAQVILEPARPWTRPGATIEVHVLLRNALADLRGYQLHVSVSGGRSGSLELTDMAIEHRKDQVFSGLGAWQALNARTKQLLAGLDGQGIATRENAYLATLTFKATRDAEGTFLVDLLHDDRDASQRTFFFPTPPGTRNLVQVIKPAAIHVGPASSRSQR